MLIKRRTVVIAALVTLTITVGIFCLSRPVRSHSYEGKSIKAWAKQLFSPDQNARNEATVVFRSLNTNTVPSLIGLLRARDPFFSRKAWAFASRLPLNQRRRILPKLSPPQEVDLHTAAARALAIIGPEARGATPDLMVAMRDPNRQVSWEAAHALGSMGKYAVPTLTEALTDRDTHVRHAAAYALGEAGPEAEPAIASLIGSLSDADEGVRSSAAYTLGSIGRPALPALIQILKETTGNAQNAAAQAISRIPASRAVAAPALLKMAKSPEPTSRKQALQTLSQLGLTDAALNDASPVR